MTTTAQFQRKVIGVPLTRALEKTSDGFLLVRGLFTSDNRDEVGDIITRAATERALPKYRRWGNIRYMHQPKPVGKVTRIGAEDGLEWNEVEIKIVDPQASFEVENGLLQALSVGILISYDDIDVMADGGWLINDYSLAEISLVDHPANYDAMLSLSLDESVKARMREEGVVPVLRSLGMHTEGTVMEKTDKSKDEGVLEAAAVASEEAVDQHTDEVAVENSLSENIAAAVEEAEATEEVVEEAQTEAADGVAEEATEQSQEDELAEVRSILSDITKSMSTFAEAISQLATEVKALTHKDEPAQEQSDEAVSATGAEAETVKALQAKVDELTTMVAELSSPTNREKSMTAEEVAEETEEESNEAALQVAGKSKIHSALAQYFKTSGR